MHAGIVELMVEELDSSAKTIQQVAELLEIKGISPA